MPGLTVTVITKNEASNIADALRSVTWADEIIVVDSESQDETVAIARQFTERVIVREWPGYIGQKNFAAAIAKHDWILSIDADERVTPALADEIRRMLGPKGRPRDAGPVRERPIVGYRIPRVTWHLGRWIRTTDWYPDYQLRLYDRRAAEWTGRFVHESVSASGEVGYLRGELQHFAYRDISDHLETIDRYTTYAAHQMHEEGRHAGPLQMALHPPFAFARNYILKRGFAQGSAGLVISALNAYYVFLKLAKLWELQLRGRTPATTAQPVGRTSEPVLGTQHPAVGTGHPASSTHHQASGTKHPS